MELKTGQVIGHYELLEQLGSGGMAVVFKAKDQKLDRHVALKFLPVQVGIKDQDKERFLLEAKTASALDHPNICTIYEINETMMGQLYIAMGYYEGETLREKIDRGPLSLKESLDITRQICLGLAKAHEKEIVHRDMKPANLIITSDGVVKILDFGVAKFQHKAQFTRTGSIIGTPGYMAPEQAAGQMVDQRTDIWAVGVLLYEMLTAHLPFEGENDLAMMYGIINEHHIPITNFKPQLSAKIQNIIKKVLTKEPNSRYQNSEQETRKMDAEISVIPSIAVLPLVDLSADRDQEYFCDGLTEEIINALTRIENLRVVSRNAAFHFKDQNLDIGQIGDRLNVQKVLEGSLRKGGNKIRVTMRLINVSDGFLLWADDYERELKDIFEIQDDISRSVVQNLKIKLVSTSESKILKKYTDDIEAFSAYLRGRFHWNKRTADSLEKSIEYFRQAIELDPAYALAYCGLADAYIILGIYGRLSPAKVMPRAIQAINSALKIDQTISEAHISLGCVESIYNWNWQEAEKHFLNGIKLNPNYSIGHQWYSINYLCPQGRFEDARTAVQNAFELEPISLVINATVGLVLYFARQFDEAVEYLTKTLEIEPEHPVTNFFLGRAYVQKSLYREAMNHFQRALKSYGDSTNMLATFAHAAALAGQREIAEKILRQLLELSKSMYVSAYDLASVYVGLKDFDAALNWLEKAYEERAYLLVYLQTDPIMDELHNKERYKKLIKKIFPEKVDENRKSGSQIPSI
jgi:serine/threonine protein kinase/Tfp pilus assembly protein PilF